MKNKVHLFGVAFGCCCALAFTLTPFVADAAPKPAKALAPVRHTVGTAVSADAKPKVMRKRMDRGNVQAKDDGCSD